MGTNQRKRFVGQTYGCQPVKNTLLFFWIKVNHSHMKLSGIHIFNHLICRAFRSRCTKASSFLCRRTISIKHSIIWEKRVMETIREWEEGLEAERNSGETGLPKRFLCPLQEISAIQHRELRRPFLYVQTAGSGRMFQLFNDFSKMGLGDVKNLLGSPVNGTQTGSCNKVRKMLRLIS